MQCISLLTYFYINRWKISFIKLRNMHLYIYSSQIIILKLATRYTCVVYLVIYVVVSKVYCCKDDYIGRVGLCRLGSPIFCQSTSCHTFLTSTLGHIKTSHGYNSQHFYEKSMFCRDLSHLHVLWQLIAHAFVTVCGSQINGPIDTHPRAVSHACDFAVIRYMYPYSIGWSVHG